MSDYEAGHTEGMSLARTCPTWDLAHLTSYGEELWERQGYPQNPSSQIVHKDRYLIGLFHGYLDIREGWVSFGREHCPWPAKE